MRALAAFAAACLALLLALPAAAQDGRPHPQDEAALIAPPPSRSLGLASDDPLAQRGPSQYFAGNVAVRLVLPESTGGADPSEEDWTPEQIAQVQASVQEALDWWAAQLPLARLRFHVRLQVVPIAYEPTRHGLADEGKWIGASLDALGFDGESYFDQAYAAADALRAELKTDWTTTIFVADSDKGDGYFSDGYFAYAYINGPFMVVTSDAGAYGAPQLAPVVAHEIGHIFGALDQYYAARVDCGRRSGYLDVPTTNSQYGACGQSEPSIMLDPITAFATGAVDGSARGQLGYHDADGDGIIDPLDTTPQLELGPPLLSGHHGRPLLRGSSADLAFPSPLQPEVSINTISAIEYRVEGGPWQRAAAEDGGFDSLTERFSAELPLYDGSYTVELRAINSAGVASSPVPRQVVVEGVGPQPVYAVTAPPLVAEPLVDVELRAPAGTAAVQLSTDIGFDEADWQPYASHLRYGLSGPGAHTIYVRFRDAAGLISLAYPVETTFSDGRTLYLPLLSR